VYLYMCVCVCVCVYVCVCVCVCVYLDIGKCCVFVSNFYRCLFVASSIMSPWYSRACPSFRDLCGFPCFFFPDGVQTAYRGASPATFSLDRQIIWILLFQFFSILFIMHGFLPNHIISLSRLNVPLDRRR